jgi:protein involved in polysaccharide export with SLBB domain
MSLIGSVPVAGHDPAAVKREIALQLRKGYLRDPHV